MYLVQNCYQPDGTHKITCILISSCTKKNVTGFFLLSHIAPNTQCVITDSHAKSLEPWYSTEHWVPSHPLLLNVPSLFPSLYISAPTHRVSTYHTSWEGDTWSSLFLWPIWSMTIANAKKGKKNTFISNQWSHMGAWTPVPRCMQ